MSDDKKKEVSIKDLIISFVQESRQYREQMASIITTSKSPSRIENLQSLAIKVSIPVMFTMVLFLTVNSFKTGTGYTTFERNVRDNKEKIIQHKAEIEKYKETSIKKDIEHDNRINNLEKEQAVNGQIFNNILKEIEKLSIKLDKL